MTKLQAVTPEEAQDSGKVPFKLGEPVAAVFDGNKYKGTFYGHISCTPYYVGDPGRGCWKVDVNWRSPETWTIAGKSHISAYNLHRVL